MMFARIRSFMTDLYSTWSADKPSRLAAALAYYGMFSIAPMLYIALTVAGIFVNEAAVTDRLFEQFARNLGPEMSQYLQDIVVGASQSSSGGSVLASLISFGALLYAATGLFSHLQYTLNTIWDVPPASYAGTVALIKNRLLAFVMVLGVALLFVVAAFASVVISILGSWLEWASYVPLATHGVLVGLLAVSFALIYKVVPDTDIAWRDVWLGAVVTALLFAAGRWVIGFYLRHSSVTSAFQAAGALAVLLIAMYYLVQIFLFGAVFTKVYASRAGSRHGELAIDQRE
ncbi:YihY/virulence factor BrkB family protein [Chloroflexota bacterium]